MPSVPDKRTEGHRGESTLEITLKEWKSSLGFVRLSVRNHRRLIACQRGKQLWLRADLWHTTAEEVQKIRSWAEWRAANCIRRYGGAIERSSVGRMICCCPMTWPLVTNHTSPCATIHGKVLLIKADAWRMA